MILFSFFLSGLFSNYFNISFFPILTAIVMLYGKKDEDFMLKLSLFIGILYDITFTNTLYLNGLLFFLFTYLLYFTNLKKCSQFFLLFFINILITILYDITTYAILLFIHYHSFSFYVLIKVLLESVITNTIYFLILYGIMYKRKRRA